MEVGRPPGAAAGSATSVRRGGSPAPADSPGLPPARPGPRPHEPGGGGGVPRAGTAELLTAGIGLHHFCCVQVTSAIAGGSSGADGFAPPHPPTCAPAVIGAPTTWRRPHGSIPAAPPPYPPQSCRPSADRRTRPRRSGRSRRRGERGRRQPRRQRRVRDRHARELDLRPGHRKRRRLPGAHRRPCARRSGHRLRHRAVHPDRRRPAERHVHPVGLRPGCVRLPRRHRPRLHLDPVRDDVPAAHHVLHDERLDDLGDALSCTAGTAWARTTRTTWRSSVRAPGTPPPRRRPRPPRRPAPAGRRPPGTPRTSRSGRSTPPAARSTPS